MNYTNKQEEKVALVTGSARRIGAAIVEHLHDAGYKVVIHCHHSLSDAHALANRLNQQRMDSAFVLQRNLSEAHGAEEIIQSVIDWAGHLDLLVNNASVFLRNDRSHFEEQEWNDLFAINVKAPFLLSQVSFSHLSQRHGAIINVTDIHGEKPLKGYSVYCQTKAALEMQTKSLAREFAPTVRVNAVAPGSIMWPEAGNSLSPEVQQKILAKTPLKNHGNPQYIAQAVLALAENQFVTGQTLKVDGGRSLD